MSKKLIISLVLICLILILLIQNAETVEIEVFFWTIAMSRVLFMVVLLFLGVVGGWFL
jgi:uncharacterized integral membrane protein